MTHRRPTALIADDEPLLRDKLARLLADAWPELEVVALARNGREAVEHFEAQQPDICFLDVHMPGLSGVQAAHHIGRRAHLVFVTAFDQYAVQAFAQGALDYLVKPVEPARLADTVARLQERLRTAQPALNTEALLQQLAAKLQQDAAPVPLRWIRATVGQSLRLIAVDEIDFLRSDEQVHADCLARRRGQAGRGADPHAAEGAGGAARSVAVRAGAPLGGGEPARDQPCQARPQRDRRYPSEGPQTKCCR